MSAPFMIVGTASIPGRGRGVGIMRDTLRRIPEGQALVLSFDDCDQMRHTQSLLIQAAYREWGYQDNGFHTQSSVEGGRYLLTIWRQPVRPALTLVMPEEVQL